MIKVALCDDIIDYNKKMESYIEKYGNENHVEVKITSYGSGSQLLLNYQKRKFDVIFLDVSMPEMDGFETAEEIRKSDTDVSIVFCTSYYTITNAGKGFEVAAEDFLSKPLLYRKVENILNKIYKKKLLNAEEKLFLKCHDGLITLQLSDIIYIQTENKLLILHTIHTYGGMARHGGGAFSGKDCTKVDRSASYAARYVAKNIVAAGLAKKCEIQLSYAIGVAHPTSIMVDTFGTGKISDESLVDMIRKEFDLRPAGIIQTLNLRRPIYKQTAAYGHFGRNDLNLPWERLDKVEELKKYLK